MSNPLHNIRQWEPVEAPLRNFEGQRDPDKLLAVVAQFEVESNPRYQATKDATFCNILLWDVTRALGAEIPHWVNHQGAPVGMHQGAELTCNTTIPWLKNHGKSYGWEEVDAEQASEHAAKGGPAIAIWANKAGPGHVAIILPPVNGHMRIAQAGRHNFFNGSLRAGFGAHGPVRFFIHA